MDWWIADIGHTCFYENDSLRSIARCFEGNWGPQNLWARRIFRGITHEKRSSLEEPKRLTKQMGPKCQAS